MGKAARSMAALGLVVVAAAGCEVRATYNATCSRASVPGTPIQGRVDAVADLPPQMGPGRPYTITVSDLGASSQAGDVHSGGIISISGPTTGAGAYYVDSFPWTLVLTNTGHGGDEVVVEVFTGDATGTGGDHMSCNVDGSTYLGRIPIVDDKAPTTSSTSTTSTTAPPE